MSDQEAVIQQIEQGDAWHEGDEVVTLEIKRPLDKIVPVRLPADKWDALRREAREIGVGPSTLVRMWVLERLRQESAHR